LPIPASPTFEAFAREAQFRHRIAVVVKASADVIFQALRDITLRDRKLAWALGELRSRRGPYRCPTLTILLSGGLTRVTSL